MRRGSILILCVGNPLRGDDAFGFLVYKELQMRGVPAIYAGSVPENFVGKIGKLKPAIVIVVDALLCRGSGVKVFRLSETGEALPATTHALSLSILFGAVGFDLSRVYIVGMPVENLDLGKPPSERVVTTARTVAEALSKLARLSSPTELEFIDESFFISRNV
ncbi:MAG: hydrogenase maturation protease [Thermofilaceae archaeon]